VEDYLEVIRQPMDLSTAMTKIDNHQYLTVKDFLGDVDLISSNALEYNPDKDPGGEAREHMPEHEHDCSEVWGHTDNFVFSMKTLTFIY